MRKLLLRNFQSPGDIVMLTAAVRDLHRAHPGQFVTDTRTACGALWENNPHITPLSEDDPEVEKFDCEYPLIDRSNFEPVHFIHGFIHDLGQRLGASFEPTDFRGDIHLSEQEKRWMSQVHEITREALPFWIIVAGGKQDFTIKWWDPRRWQQVVDHFRDRILFVQVGEAHHCHPPLEGVLDLRGKTDLRQLVRLVYHSQGVVSPVTLLMHLAAAVEVKGGFPKNRPCVVVAGGREPAQWEAYPHHQFIHTNGALPCCDQGGCWKSRTVPLGDGDSKDDDLCLDVVQATSRSGSTSIPLPRCMDLISASDVIQRVELYFRGGSVDYLSPAQAKTARAAIVRHSERRRIERDTAARVRQERSVVFITVTDAEFFAGTAATVSSILRFHRGARICVVNNHVDATGLSPAQREVFTEQGITIVDAEKLARPARKLGAWELKAYAAADLTAGDEVLIGIDSDCVLCGRIDDLFADARTSGCFIGGKDDVVFYDETYHIYGIKEPVRNERYMSTSLYACALTEENRTMLQRWADCCDQAEFGQRGGEYPGHGDQGVLNAVLHAARGGAGVRLLDNPLWSQHWCYWDHRLRLEKGRLFNEAAGALQRAIHCGGTEKFWSREHFERVEQTGECTLNYAWYLALLWFGACRVRVEHLPPQHAHLSEALARHRHTVLELAALLQPQLASVPSA